MPASQAIVEIGAYQGGSAKFVAEVLRHIGRPLPFYVCDTYEGHVVVDPELDPKQKVGVQFRSTSAERVVKYLEAYEFVHVIKGDIQATAATLPHDRARSVRVEGITARSACAVPDGRGVRALAIALRCPSTTSGS